MYPRFISPPTTAPVDAWTLDTGRFALFTRIIVATADNWKATRLELLIYVILLARHCIKRHPQNKNPIDAPSPPAALNYQLTYEEPYKQRNVLKGLIYESQQECTRT